VSVGWKNSLFVFMFSSVLVVVFACCDLVGTNALFAGLLANPCLAITDMSLSGNAIDVCIRDRERCFFIGFFI
jgi:hypothetical protein